MALDAVMNGLSTVTGSVEKAVIRIKDDRANKNESLKKHSLAKFSSAGAFGAIGDTSTLTSFVPNPGDMITNLVKNKLGISSRLAPSEYDRSIAVQFNPSSLKISGHGGDDDVQITNYTQDSRGVSRGAVNLHLDMSVNLIFDQISNTAAFQQDMLTFSSSRLASSVGKQAGNALASMIMGNVQSVQVTVEAFIAALRNPMTRMVCFEWGELCYEGVLRQVNTTYTMFDINGDPVRAEVGLMIYLIESSAQGITDYTNRYWYTAYYNAFVRNNPVADAMLKMADFPAN